MPLSVVQHVLIQGGLRRGSASTEHDVFLAQDH